MALAGQMPQGLKYGTGGTLLHPQHLATPEIFKKNKGEQERTKKKKKQESPCKHQAGHLAPRYLSAFKSVFILAWAAGLFEVKGGQFVRKTKAPFPFIPREGEEGKETTGGRRMLLYI